MVKIDYTEYVWEYDNFTPEEVSFLIEKRKGNEQMVYGSNDSAIMKNINQKTSNYEKLLDQEAKELMEEIIEKTYETDYADYKDLKDEIDNFDDLSYNLGQKFSLLHTVSGFKIEDFEYEKSFFNPNADYFDVYNLNYDSLDNNQDYEGGWRGAKECRDTEEEIIKFALKQYPEWEKYLGLKDKIKKELETNSDSSDLYYSYMVLKDEIFDIIVGDKIHKDGRFALSLIGYCNCENGLYQNFVYQKFDELEDDIKKASDTVRMINFVKFENSYSIPNFSTNYPELYDLHYESYLNRDLH